MFHLNIPPKCLVGLVLFYFALCAWNRPCSPVSEAAISSVQCASGTAEALSSGALSSQRCPHSACPNPTWALSLWLFPAAQSSVVFPAPLLTPWLGCRTQQLAAENVRDSTKGRVMDSSLLGYNWNWNWKHSGGRICREDTRLSLIGTDASSKPWQPNRLVGEQSWWERIFYSIFQISKSLQWKIFFDWQNLCSFGVCCSKFSLFHPWFFKKELDLQEMKLIFHSICQLVLQSSVWEEQMWVDPDLPCKKSDPLPPQTYTFWYVYLGKNIYRPRWAQAREFIHEEGKQLIFPFHRGFWINK